MNRFQKIKNKIYTLIWIIILGSLIAGVYGILHDQISYSVSEEYFTKFKFIQFGIQNLPNRIGAGIVGFLATWWVGFPIAMILGLWGLRFAESKIMFKETIKSIGLALLVAFGTALLGLLIGSIVYQKEDMRNFEGWILPADVVDTRRFKIVGVMHFFSYFGGLTGLIAGLVRQIIKTNRFDAQIIKYE